MSHLSVEGGGTNFPHLGIEVKPKRGSVVLWPSVLDNEPHAKDDRTEHEALPVIKGVKYGAVRSNAERKWQCISPISLFSFRTPGTTNAKFKRCTRWGVDRFRVTFRWCFFGS